MHKDGDRVLAPALEERHRRYVVASKGRLLKHQAGIEHAMALPQIR
jgi:hypothetical protein